MTLSGPRKEGIPAAVKILIQRHACSTLSGHLKFISPLIVHGRLGQWNRGPLKIEPGIKPALRDYGLQRLRALSVRS